MKNENRGRGQLRAYRIVVPIAGLVLK